MFNLFKNKKRKEEKKLPEVSWNEIYEKTRTKSIRFPWRKRIIEIKPHVVHRIYLVIVVFIVLLLLNTIYNGFYSLNNRQGFYKLKNYQEQKLVLPPVDKNLIKKKNQKTRADGYDSLINISTPGHNYLTTENIRKVDSLYSCGCD